MLDSRDEDEAEEESFPTLDFSKDFGSNGAGASDDGSPVCKELVNVFEDVRLSEDEMAIVSEIYKMFRPKVQDETFSGGLEVGSSEVQYSEAAVGGLSG